MLALFTNAVAGKGHAVQSTKTVQAFLQEQHIPFQTFDAPWPGELTGITEAWIIGGDGTLNFFINQYPDATIPLAMIPGGTGDDFAWHLYGDRPLADLLPFLLRNASIKLVDAGSCNGQYFLNSVGIGFDGEVLKSMAAIRRLGGHLGYLWVVIKKIFSFRELTFNLTVNHSRKTNRYLLVNIANAPRTGGGFLVSPLADCKDGKLNLMTCEALSIGKRLRYLPVIEKGRHLSLSFIHHTTLQEITIETEQPSFAQLDGELISASRYDIRMHASKFRFKC